MGNFNSATAEPPRHAPPGEVTTARRFMSEAHTSESLGLCSGGEDGEGVATARNVPIALNQWSARSVTAWPHGAPAPLVIYPVDRRAKYDVTLDETFSSDSRAILVSGEAGSGKTHLFTKIVPHLWSNGLLWQDRFDLVAVFGLDNPDVQRAASLTELLAVFLEDVAMASGEESAAYFSDGSATEKRLCLIFDGLSECELNDCSDFLRAVLSRKVLHNSSLILLTQRLEDFLALKNKMSYGYILEVAGFQQSAVHSYIRQRLSAEQAQALLAELDSDLTTATLMTVPIVTVATCQAVIAGARQPSCLTSAMQCIVLLALNQGNTSANHAAAASDAAGGHVSFQSLADLPPSVVESLLPIGRFALENLMRRKFAFKLSELEAAGLASAATHLGLVVARKRISANRGQWHAFSSPSLQEFLAAWFAVSRLMHTRRQAVSLVEQIGPCPDRLNMFWRYVIALAPTTIADGVMSSIWLRIRKKDPYSSADDSVAPLVRELVSASGEYLTATELEQVRAILVESLSHDSQKLEELANTLLHHSGDITMVTTTGEKSGHQRVLHALGTSTAGTADSTAYIATVLALWLAEHTDGSSNGVQLYDALLQVSDDLAQACKPILLPKWMIGEAIERLLDSYEYLRGSARSHYDGIVRTLEAYFDHCRMPEHRTGKRPEFVTVDRSVPGLGIDLYSTQLSPLQSCAVAIALAAHADCRASVSLGSCHLGNGTFAHLAPALRQCRQLGGLNLRECDITDSTLLASVLEGKPKISSVALNQCRIGDSGFAELAPHLLESRELVGLYLAGTGLTDDSLLLLARLIRALPKLGYLHLDRNFFPDVAASVAEEFVAAVREAPQLHQLSVPYGQVDDALLQALQDVADDVAFPLEQLLKL